MPHRNRDMPYPKPKDPKREAKGRGSAKLSMVFLRTGKGLSLLGRYGAQVAQIALVADEHDDNVGVGVVAQFLEPPGDVLVGLVLADIVDEEGADSTTVVGRGDGAVTLLAGGIPNLCLDGLGVDLDRPGGELDADGRLGVEVELVASESAEQVGLSDARVSDQHH